MNHDGEGMGSDENRSHRQCADHRRRATYWPRPLPGHGRAWLDRARPLSSLGRRKPVSEIEAPARRSAHGGDLATSGGPDRVIDGALAAGPLDLIVNCASVFAYDEPALTDAAIFQEAMAVNLRAPMRLAERLYHHVLARDAGGVVVNILDNGINALTPDYYSYMTTKVGLAAATRMMAMRFAPHLRVGGVAPGLTLISGDQTPAEFARDHGRNPLGRGCDPQDIARAIRFMVDTRR